MQTVPDYDTFLQSTISNLYSFKRESMAKSLKQKNQPQLVTFMMVNIMGLGAIALGLPHLQALIAELTKGNGAILGKLIAVPAVLALVTGVLGWVMPNRGEDALVFWKIGKHCLPSSRAFTILGPADPRVDMQRLVLRNGPLPTLPAEQTALWYRMYRSHSNEVSIEDAHGAYLRFREMTTLTFALLLSCLGSFVWFHVPGKRLAFGCLLLVIEYLFLMLAARNAALHFVSNVLALESSTPLESPPVP